VKTTKKEKSHTSYTVNGKNTEKEEIITGSVEFVERRSDKVPVKQPEI
jgi:hypothetical protein